MPDDFKFPDEAEERKVSAEQDDSAVKEEDDIEVELVDDTPAKDRGRKPLDKEVADPTDDEIENYSDKVQARIKELTHARHDERRVKESLLREKQEMERLMSHLADENKKLKQTVNYGQEVYISTAKDAAEAQLNDARRQYKDAQESYDSDAILAAQEALMDAKTRLDQVKNYRATPLQEDEPPVQREPSQTQAVGPDEKTLRWQAKNQWYGQSGFEEYTSYALGLHHKLVNAGISPRSDEYFAQIEGRMKSTFPELFGETAAEKPQSETPTTSSKRPSSVVAPASRSTGKRTIQLTPTQYALAKKYGLTPQQYAAEVSKLERNNG